MSGSRRPGWLRVRIPSGEGYFQVRTTMRDLRLPTVCEGARCPNIGECWPDGTVTILLMGEICTRACRFCAVTSGRPRPLDPDEPGRVARAISRLGLGHAVLTSVCRDDLDDGGASHFARTVSAVRDGRHGTVIETLIPDFKGDRDALDTIIGAAPDIVAHNIETVERLTRAIRDRRASYRTSLDVLAYLSSRSRAWIKSSIMLGLGESEDEVTVTMGDLKDSGVRILTLGQYLQPTRAHLPVKEYITPETFKRYRDTARAMGFDHVLSGPLVRSSYRSGRLPRGPPVR